MTNSAIIFRKTLLPYSETFIASQGAFLPTMQAAFLGYKKKSPGYGWLKNHHSFILDDCGPSSILNRAKLALGLGLPQSLVKHLNNLNPSVIHAHFGTNAYSAIPIAKQLNIPLITTFHGYDITKKGNHSSKKLQKVFKHSNQVIAVSKHIQKQLIQANCPESKITQHYIGIDTEFFKCTKNESENPSILFVGRLTEKKGCRYLISAFQDILKKFPKAELNIVGDGPLKEELVSQADSSSNINFLGVKNTSEIRELLSSSWVFCTPSITAKSGDEEGLGMVFLEAQSMQTPAVSFDTGGTVEAISHGNTGFNLPEKDVDALTDTLQLLLGDNSLRAQMGIAARKWVLEHFDIRKQCEKLEEIYRSCQ